MTTAHFALCSLALLALSTPVLGQVELRETEERILHYHSSEGLADPVALLQKQIAEGKRRLKYESGHGYLVSLLSALQVPVSSQGLVFSRTSSQADYTSPKTPRAIYFNHEVYVGWTPGSDVIDLAAMDPNRGPIFYTLAQASNGPPRFTRREDCLRCHEVAKTQFVPGLLVRSMYTAPDGTPLAQVLDFVNGHNSSMRVRWGGWYVTGTHLHPAAPVYRRRARDDGQGEPHLGNLFSTNRLNPEDLNPKEGANITDLRPRFDTSRYLSRHSDIVALLVLEHELRMHNLLTRANFETRLALADLAALPPNASGTITGNDAAAWPRQRIEQAGESLLEYMLFRNEAPLQGRVEGTSKFAAEFQKLGPRASHGRSLFQLDLRTRLVRYPCSFLIYSPSFDALPAEMKTYLWRRLDQILSGNDHSPTFDSMPISDRQAVFEILRQSKPEFAAWLRH